MALVTLRNAIWGSRLLAYFETNFLCICPLQIWIFRYLSRFWKRSSKFRIFIYFFVEYIFQANYLSLYLKKYWNSIFPRCKIVPKQLQEYHVIHSLHHKFIIKLSPESFHKRVFPISSFLSFDDTYITYISITSRDVDDTIMHILGFARIIKILAIKTRENSARMEKESAIRLHNGDWCIPTSLVTFAQRL